MSVAALLAARTCWHDVPIKPIHSNKRSIFIVFRSVQFSLSLLASRFSQECFRKSQREMVFFSFAEVSAYEEKCPDDL